MTMTTGLSGDKSAGHDKEDIAGANPERNSPSISSIGKMLVVIFHQIDEALG